MKLKELKKTIGRPYFSRADMNLLGDKVFDYQISFWQKNHEIERLKRGVYIFSEEKEKVSAEEIAFILYEPSYISLEYALNHYGIIPEAVFNVTSVTTKTTRKFSNDFGLFSYRSIKPGLYFGYNVHQTDYGKYLLAMPEKALLDYVYLNLGKINNERDVEEIRINYDRLSELISKKKIKDYLKEYKIKKLDRIINLILKKC
jgi:hypothetical protein